MLFFFPSFFFFFSIFIFNGTAGGERGKKTAASRQTAFIQQGITKIKTITTKAAEVGGFMVDSLVLLFPLLPHE
jgi:hypothetical protein